MSDFIAPESRIFRIGRECYVVYLGKERDDINPFLRIGNTRDLPDEVYDVVSTTVVTDDHVGNPLLEIQNASKVHGRYLGDTSVVGEIRKFFKSFDLSTDEVTDYRKVKDGEKRHMVWFYSSGNIHLRYDDAIIFDMDKREKADRHFIRLYEEAKAEFLRNPLRYIKQDFAGPGMVLSGGNAFWYEGGEMLALEAHSGFVARLMNDGVDPDFITASCYNLDADAMDSHDAAVFIGFVKRTRQRKKQLRILTTKPGLQRKLKLLFPARGDVPATLEVTDVSGKKKATFKDSIISRKDGTWLLHRAGLPEISVGNRPENGISIDVPNGIISIHKDGAETKLNTPQGCPIDFLRQQLPETQLTDKYISLIHNQLKDHFGPGEAQAAASLEKYIRMLRDDISAGKATASMLLKQNSAAARDNVKKAIVSEGGPSWYFYSNALTILEILTDQIGSDHQLAKNAENVMAALQHLLSRIPGPDRVHPFWADLYMGDEPRLLWKAAKRNYVPADVGAADSVNDKISEITSLDEAPWNEDRERLLRLIRSLGQGGKGPLTEEQIALLQNSEEENKSVKKKEDKSFTPSVAPTDMSTKTEKVSKEKDSESDKDESSFSVIAGKKSSSSSRSGGRKIWLWVLLVLLLLLLGGAVAWDLSGDAPWGSVLSSRAGDRDGESYATGETGSNTDGDTNNGTAGDTSGTSTGNAGGDLPGDTSGNVTGNTGGDLTGNSGSNTGGNASANTTGTVNAQPVDPDVAPRTEAEFEAYLSVDGRVAITEADIHLAANEIAVLNGFKDLDYRVYTGEDPDWIYPENVLKLPGSEDYTVKSGDTIWFLAAREVRVDVNADLKVYDVAAAILDDSASDQIDRTKSLEDLERIAQSSRAEDLRQMAVRMLTSKQ